MTATATDTIAPGAAAPGADHPPHSGHAPHKRHLAGAIPPAARHVREWRYFAGLFGGEHIAATEFVIGVTFVTMGVDTMNLLVGLLIGNFMAVVSWTIVTTPIAVKTRRSLFTYLEQIAGPVFTKIYNIAILLFYGSLAAAMITVSSYALRFALGLPVQLAWYPTSVLFIVATLVLGAVVVAVASRGFEAMANFATICAPWMLTCFICGAAVALPAIALEVTGDAGFGGFDGFLSAAREAIWTGTTLDGQPGISVWEVAAFAWANGAMVHLGLIDMAIFRFAKKKYYGVFSSVGMFLGHYVGWISAGLMGAGAAIMVGKSLTAMDSADVAWGTLGYIGILVVICAGWTTANACLYRAGLAATTLVPQFSRQKVTAGVGVVIVVAACFPFVAQSVMPLTVYGAILLCPIGAIVIAEHYLLPRIGLTRYWSRYHDKSLNPAALLTWVVALGFAGAMVVTEWISFYYIFLPEYVLSLLLYPALAAMMGARDNWPKDEAHQAEREAALVKFEKKRDANAQQQAEDEEEDPSNEHTARIAKWLLLGAVVMLLSMIGLAVQMSFSSPTAEALVIMRSSFFFAAVTCTIGYFILAMLAMRVTDANEA